MRASFTHDRPDPISGGRTRWTVLGVASLLAAGLAGCSGKLADGSVPLGLDKVPHRKPGLWAQQIVTDANPAVLSVQLCIDGPSEKIMLLGARSTPGTACGSPRFYRRPDGAITFSSACSLGGKVRMSSDGVVTGDLNSQYAAVVTSRVAIGDGAPQSHTLRTAARWSGACPDGARGGDMFLANGLHFNILGPGQNTVFPDAK
jgi:hypothetical protein